MRRTFACSHSRLSVAALIAAGVICELAASALMPVAAAAQAAPASGSRPTNRPDNPLAQTSTQTPGVPAVGAVDRIVNRNEHISLKGLMDRATRIQPTTPPGSAPAPLTLNLDQAVAVGINNSRQLKLAAEAVQRARGVLNESRAGFLPSVGSTTTFTHIEPGSSFTIAGPNGQPVTVPLVVQNQWQVNTGINIPIDLAGLILAAVQQAQFEEIAARLDYNRLRNQAVLDVKSDYFDVLRAKALVTVAEQNLKDAQDQQTTAQQQLDAGIGTRFDVLRAATAVANAQQSLIAARNQVNLATATLNNVLGLDQNTPTQTVETALTPPPAADFNNEVAEAYAKRPEVLQADANIRAAEKGLILAIRSVLPTLGVGLTVGYNPTAAGFAPLHTTYASTATLNFPLFDQGLANARKQQARATLETQRTNKQITQDTVALQVRQAYLALTEAQDRLNVTTAALGEAQEQYRLAQVRFRAGVTATPGGSPLLEVSDALAALTQAQTNQVTAQYDVETAEARLDQAIGRYGYAGAGNPGIPAPPTNAAPGQRSGP